MIFDGNGSTSGIMRFSRKLTALRRHSRRTPSCAPATASRVGNQPPTARAPPTPGATYPFSANAVLYAQWSAPVFSVTFDGNGSTSGIMGAETNSVPAPLSANAFVRTGYSFTGWNTAANGSGTVYAAGATFPSPSA